jgi:hypothetical protein
MPRSTNSAKQKTEDREAPIRELLLRRVPGLLDREGSKRLEQFSFIVAIGAKRVTDGRIRRGTCIATLLEVAGKADIPTSVARRTIRQVFGEAGRPLGSNAKDSSARKKRGRPATGVTPMIGVRVSTQLRTRIESWARSRPDEPSLSEATRRLIELALKGFRSGRSAGPSGS